MGEKLGHSMLARLGAIALALLLACSVLVACDDPQPSSTRSDAILESSSSAAPTSSEAASSQGTAPDSASLADYVGIDVVEVNGNTPAFTERDKSLPLGTEQYSDFDDLGRAGQAMAVVGEETMPTTKRTGQTYKPTGWVQAFYQDSIGLEHLYERSHLLAHSLTAENDNPQNLITGTMHMNKLMIPYETQVADYINRTGNHVLYRVTPCFEGNELVARAVQMEAMSLEDDGASLSYNIAIYNVQPQVGIDYATGNSWLESETVTPASSTAIAEPSAVTAASSVSTYVLNTSSKRIH